VTTASVLLVTRNLPPLVGGMERLVQKLALAIAAQHPLAVVGPAGCAAFLPAAATVREVGHGSLARFLAGAAIATQRTGPRHGLVVAGSGLAAPLALLAARRCRAPWVVYLHGLDIVAPSRVYQHCWLPCIRRADLVLANSRNTRDLAIAHGVRPEAIEVLNPGTELPGHDAEAARAFREAHGLGDRPLMLSVGRLTPRKGLAEFIGKAMPAIVARNPGALLLVVGDDASDAVGATRRSGRARILEAARAAGVAESVRLLPRCDDAALSAGYNAADAHVFPVLDLPGDVEGFGMVAIEAAARGLPTVAFDVGGVADAVQDGTSESLVAPGDYAAFVAALAGLLGREGQAATRLRCMDFAADFGWDRFAGRLHAILHSRFPQLGDGRHPE
jgi:phosphatidylinositol alpha-1,6-mannosyltransferase